MSKLLIVDDDDYVLKSLVRLLRSSDYDISCYSDPEEALKQCGLQKFDLILSDQKMPSMEGTEFFTHIAQLFPQTRRILISGYSDFTSVTEAFNDGIIHKFVIKPWSNELLENLISDQLKLGRQEHSLSASESREPNPSKVRSNKPGKEVETADSFHGIITANPSMLQQISIIKKTANSDAPFFIHGETGTGKELVAQSIHLESDRLESKFVALNCANLTDTLLESQLFGHMKGAFTGAQKDQKGLIAEAEGGTLFLDEVTEIPMNLQAKLLRVLQEREYTPVGETKAIPFDVKLISASSTSLEKAVSMGTFREDLRYRLEVLPISLPPLRARTDDIKILFDYFLAEQFQKHNKSEKDVEDSVYECIQSYGWPGNIRELVNVCTYIAALSSDDSAPISLESLPIVVISNANLEKADLNSAVDDAKRPPSNSKRVKEISKASLELAIENFGGHRESIASYFGISRMTLWRKMKQFDLEN
ncbi:MAG: DNA-binding NtrC family response regulator [Pseudohongiellaceae bacterium]|jgi:DNA-binding NtrC family response regulator